MRYFVIRGFGKKKDGEGNVFDFDDIERRLITPAMQRIEALGGTTGILNEAGSIHEDMFAMILEADLVVCDVTVHNANVFYELGVRHALRKRSTLLIKARGSKDTTPFDIGGFRYLDYDPADPGAAVDRLAGMAADSLRSDRPTDSPAFFFMSRLQEAPAEVLLPRDFDESVRRARAAKDLGWLSLLAAELKGQRFEHAGRREIARAQFDLGDHASARPTWQRIRDRDPKDVEALCKLSNIAERAYRQSRDPAEFDVLNDALVERLKDPGLAPSDRAEMQALVARNLKTRWRQAFDREGDPARRRELACDARLLDSHDAYHAAYLCDLNNFYSGLGALQMALVMRSLRADADATGWAALFTDEQQQRDRERSLDERWARLSQAVPLAIERTLAIEKGSADAVWARISQADVRLVLDGADGGRFATAPAPLVNLYRNAVPDPQTFGWGAVIGQLRLFESLGVASTAARAVIDRLEGTATAAAAAPPTLVLFAGHTVDTPGRATARFPASAEPAVRARLREALVALQQAEPNGVHLLASAAPGADILVHELCGELGIPATLCLPMPVDHVVQSAFGGMDDWLNRLLQLRDRHGGGIRVLQGDGELPSWLHGRDTDPWDRGNRWMVATALRWNAPRRVLLTLWDRDETQGLRGGTTQVVRLARESGAMRIVTVDCREAVASAPV